MEEQKILRGQKIKQGLYSFFILFMMTTILVLVGVLPLKASALSTGGISAFPSNPDPDNLASKSWFIYNLDLGEEKEDSITIRNDSDEQQVLRVYAVDSIANNMGGFALGKESDEAKDVGSWIKLEKNEVTLEPGHSEQIPFTIKIPENASVGEHAGGVIVQKGLTEEQKNAKGGFVITTRLGVRIYQTVPGEIVRKMEFGDIDLEFNKVTGKYSLNIEVKNLGNTTMEPRVRVQIIDKFFKKQNATLENAVRAPRESKLKTRFEFNRPRGGKFDIKVDLVYEDNGKNDVSIAYPNPIGFWVIPWSELLVVIVIVLANLIFFFVDWIIKRKDKKFYKEYTVHDGEDLVEIADILGVKWKKLAKINKIKPPYKLTEGQIIIVIDKNDLVEYDEEEEIVSSAKPKIRKTKKKKKKK